MGNMKEETTKDIINGYIKNNKAIRCEAAKAVRGGFCLKIVDENLEGYDAFMPASMGIHHGTRLVDVTQDLRVHIVEINTKRPKSLIVNGLGQLKTWIYEQEHKALSSLRVGDVIHGVVNGIGENAEGIKYGVFVDLGAVRGLLHASKLAGRNIDEFEKGAPINVEIESIDWQSHRLGLILPVNEPTPEAMVRKIMGKIDSKEKDEKLPDLVFMEASALKKTLEGMEPEEQEACLPKLQKRADWRVRKVLKGKYDWPSVVGVK